MDYRQKLAASAETDFSDFQHKAKNVLRQNVRVKVQSFHLEELKKGTNTHLLLSTLTVLKKFGVAINILNSRETQAHFGYFQNIIAPKNFQISNVHEW